jgi:hypothetical protein
METAMFSVISKVDGAWRGRRGLNQANRRTRGSFPMVGKKVSNGWKNRGGFSNDWKNFSAFFQ